MYQLDTLAHRISLHGIETHEEEVKGFADWAFRRGLSPTLAGILADDGAPAAARERAFARLTVAARSLQPAGFESVA